MSLNRDYEVYYGNRILAEAGLPVMTPAQEQSFLKKREERAGYALAYSAPIWVIIAGGTGLLGYLIGRRK